jgi:hypothetical protein
MVTGPYSEVDRDLYPATMDSSAGAPAIAWSAVSAGTVAAIAVTLTLVVLGSAFGLASASPWPGVGAKPSTFTIGAGIWLVVTQWLSAAMGGYIAGRLRVRWHGLHTDEVFFRDTAHGFLSWAVATLGVAVLAVAVAGLGVTVGPAAAVQRDVDAMFHLAGATTAQASPAQRAEAERILLAVGAKAPPTADRTALADLVAAGAGVPAAEAQRRADAAIVAVQQRTEAARKAAAGGAIFTALAMLIGAFIASVAAALGGRLRDERP